MSFPSRMLLEIDFKQNLARKDTPDVLIILTSVFMFDLISIRNSFPIMISLSLQLI